MSVKRVLVFLLVALQVAVFVWLYGSSPLHAVALLLAAIGLSRRIQVPLSWDRELLYSLALAVPVALVALRSGGWPTDASALVDQRISIAFGHYFILLQVAQLYLKREEDVSPIIVTYAAGALVCAGNLMTDAPKDLAYQVAALAGAALIGLFCAITKRQLGLPGAGSKRRRTVLSAALLVAGFGLAAVTGAALRHYSDQINNVEMLLVNRLFSRMPAVPGRTSFGDSMRLGSIRRLKIGALENQPALRVYSEERPGYLRGHAYDRYEGSGWEAAATARSLGPLRMEGGPPGTEGMNGFEVGYLPTRSSGPVGNWRQRALCDVWPDPSVDQGMFLPENTHEVWAAVDEVEVDEHHVVDSPDLPAGANYVARVPELYAGGWILPRYRGRYLRLPDTLDPRVHELAERVFAQCRTTDEKIAAVTRHFTANYEYSLDIQIPDGEDPLTYFLLEKPPAYCEYFASGAAVLLRLAGVPTRYAAGYVPGARNPFGDFWVARHKDAHAWCEAYHEEKGWLIVEATPAAGVPSQTDTRAAALSALWDYLRFRRQELSVLIQTRGLRGLGLWMFARLRGLWALLLSTSPLGWLLKLCLAVYFGWLLWRRVSSRTSAPRKDPHLAKLHQLLAAMDRKVAKHGILRREGETLHRFAARLAREGPSDLDCRPVSQWYALYAATRYRGEVDAAAIGKLATAMPPM